MSLIKINLTELVGQGIISSDQAVRIQHHTISHTEEARTSRFLQILSSVGAITAGLGIILYFAANWAHMTDVVKTITLIGSTLLCYLAGYWLSFRSDNFCRTGQSLLILGAIMYGTSIFLLQQIYNIGSTYSSAFGWWSLGVIALAYATQFSSIFMLGVTLGFLYIFSLFTENQFQEYALINMFIALGYLLLALIRYHTFNRYFQSILVFFGSLSLLSGLLVYTFEDMWRFFSSDLTEQLYPTLCIAIGFLLIVIDMSRKRTFSIFEHLPYVLGLIPLTFLGVFGILGVHTETTFLAIYGYILMNITLIALVVFMAYAGIRRGLRGLTNMALFATSVYLFGHYISFAFESKMDGALVFITGGVVLILIGVLTEMVRRRLMKNIVS